MQVAGEAVPSGTAETGGWVSKAQVTCLGHGDNPPKGELIPDNAAAPHGARC